MQSPISKQSTWHCLRHQYVHNMYGQEWQFLEERILINTHIYLSIYLSIYIDIHTWYRDNISVDKMTGHATGSVLINSTIRPSINVSRRWDEIYLKLWRSEVLSIGCFFLCFFKNLLKGAHWGYAVDSCNWRCKHLFWDENLPHVIMSHDSCRPRPKRCLSREHG